MSACSVTYRQLVRHDLDGAWKHTDGLAAVEVLVEERVAPRNKGITGKLDASPSLVPAASAEPLSFTKTTMAALPLLALPAARRHAYAASILRASTAPALQRNEARTAPSSGDSKSGSDCSGESSSDGNPFGGSFQAAFDAENAAADAEAEALDVNLEGVDGAGVDELVAEMLKGMAFEAQDFEASAAQFNSSSSEGQSGGGPGSGGGSSGDQPGMRVLVVGLSNACDLARFAMRLGGNRVDGVDAFGPGLAVARLRHVEQHLGLDLSAMAYVSLDQPSLWSGLQALEADGEAPPAWTMPEVPTAPSTVAASDGDTDGKLDDACPTLVPASQSPTGGLKSSSGGCDWLIDGSSSQLYDAIVLDWAAESGSGTGPAAVTDELSNLVALVAPWLSPTGLLCLGMGAGFASGGQYGGSSSGTSSTSSTSGGGGSGGGGSSGAKAALAVQKACAACGLAGFAVVSDASSREEPHLAESVVVASRATLVLPGHATSPTTVVAAADTGTASEEAAEVELTADAWVDAFGPGSSGAECFRLPMTLQEGELDEASAVAGPSSSSSSNVPRVWAFWAEAENAEVDDRVAAAKPGEGIAADVWNEAFGSDDSDDDSDNDGVDKGSSDAVPQSDDEVSRREAWASVMSPSLRAACPAMPLLRACQAALAPEAEGHAEVGLSPKTETTQKLPAVQFPALVVKPGALQAQLDTRGYAVCSSGVSTTDSSTAEVEAEEGQGEGAATTSLGSSTPVSSLRHDEPALLSFVHGAVLALKRKQLAPAHVYLYDATWELALRVWPLAEAVLGKDCVLEPSFAAFALDPQKAGTSYVGTNFGRPHRDYSYADSLEANATAENGSEASQKLKVLSVWVPLNGVNTSNGCMYVVPRPCDTGFADPLSAEGLQSPRVPAETVGGVVPLAPHPPGTFMCWTGNTVHWGSACAREGAADPRASLAFVFRRAGARLSVAEVSLTRSDIAAADTATRLQWVHKAIGFFKHWYPDASLDYKALPWASKGAKLATEDRAASKKHVMFS